MNETCEIGHDIDTDHNNIVLGGSNIGIKHVRQMKKHLKPDIVSPDLCEDYNLGRGCDQYECLKMHICAEFIQGTCGGCGLNHDLLSGQCKTLLNKTNINLRRTRRELKMCIQQKCDNIQHIVRALEDTKKNMNQDDEGDLRTSQPHQADFEMKSRLWKPKPAPRRRQTLNETIIVDAMKLANEPEFERLKEEVRLAEKMKEFCDTKDGYIYELQPMKTKGDFKNRVQKQEIGNRSPEDGVGKVLMLVGTTGAGKSTLIHGFANYAYGVKWTDDFRFKLACDEEKTGKTEAHSQTKWISAYVLTKQQGMAFPYTLTVIDTPGFGDTEGIKKDDELKNQIREFFSHDGHLGVDQLDGIGFVVQSSQARLTPTQKYVFDCVLSVFGNDVKDNIFLLANFSDNQTPPVMIAVKEGNIPCRKMFKFNNSALFVQNKEDEFGKAYWKMGITSFKEFFRELENTNAVSLTLTKEVLNERRALEETLQSIKSQLDAALDRLELLREAHAAVRHHGGQQLNVYASSVSSEEEEEEADNSRARCSHPNRTIHSYDERVLKKLTKGFNQNRELVLQLTKQAHACKRRLDEIALKPDPLEFTDYIDILISNEKYDKQPGSSQRIKYLQAARENAEFAMELQSFNPSDVLDELDIGHFDPPNSADSDVHYKPQKWWDKLWTLLPGSHRKKKM
ncbi:unnamed protein product [Darwinula stevensoni]|uniref:Septin-type G domain-containing protein n=1 Tax=Darwinula stevensoni TaxID=69355 RepID=A0A7R9A8S5_9CRUS|nr:unnamed protein product [Darwinula stevensoni]CAG0896687.1 unnamed protein product [Darwinula stevensoni]